MKRTIRLKESELRQMIAESVKRVLNEFEDDFDYVDGDNQQEYPFDYYDDEEENDLDPIDPY